LPNHWWAISWATRDERPRGVEAVFAVEDGGGVFGATADAVGLDVGEFFVGEGADVVADELDGFSGGVFDGGVEGFGILVIDPGLQGDAADVAGVMDGELGDADGIEPGGDGDGVFPVGESGAVAIVDLFDEQAVGDDLVFGRGGDEHFAGGFVVGMVDAGEPLVGAVGPVLAEDGAFFVFVEADVDAGGGDAVVLDVEGELLAGFDGLVEGDGEFVVGVGVFDGPAGERDGGDGHADGGAAAVGGWGGQVEEERGEAVLGEEDFVGGLADEFVGVVGDGQVEDVVLGVDAVLAGPGVGEGWGGEKEGEQREAGGVHGGAPEMRG